MPRARVALIVRSRAVRSRGSRAVLVAAAGCALVIAATGRGEPSVASGTLVWRSSTATARPAAVAAAFTLMQTNLCLSGMARCYAKVAYPAVLEDTVARIRATRPDAVTVNEACHRDVAQIARRTGYHLRFSTVTSSAGPIRCIRPDGRGRFGDAVLTKAEIERSESHDFEAQAGRERRRWLCVTTGADIDVCTAHLAMPSPVEAAGNDAQCAELAAILARRMTTHAVIFGGDVNRRRPCAPDGLWTRTDGRADQAPRLQHVYGTSALGSPSVQVLPATHTDHDVLLIHAHPVAPRAAARRPSAGRAGRARGGTRDRPSTAAGAGSTPPSGG